MSYDYDRDKLREAKNYLLKYSPNTQEFEAALQHVKWVYDHNHEMIGPARAVLLEVMDTRREEKPIMDALLREFA